MNGWNFADVFDALAGKFPDAHAQRSAGRAFTWREFSDRADGVAATLLAAGAQHQDKVAQYLFNGPEYLESVYAAWKAGLVPVNTNYRYLDDELVYLWDNADAVAVVFHGTFTERIDGIRARVPRVRTWLWVDDGSGPCPPWAVPYDDAAAHQPAIRPVRAPWGRSGDDLFLLYTGGTTGMPKGVMWRQDDIFGVLDATAKPPMGAEQDLHALLARTTRPGPVAVPAAPLMHGTAAFNAFSVLMMAGCIVTMPGRHYSPAELLDTIERERVNSISIVGDAFAKPMLRALDAEPQRWDISSLRVIMSSGVMWSAETKAGLLRHNPRLILVDALGSSEAIGMANDISTADGGSKTTAAFTLGPNTKVITDDGRDVVPGSGERGRLALKGRVPLGYYKDPEKSAATFVTIGDARYSIPGDWAEVDADGTVRLLGRGSVCINTGGEKVYPEEVEEVLKLHPSVADAVVVGVPDEKWGEAITAMVEPYAGVTVDEADVIAHVKARLAPYKAPKRVLTVDTIGRAPNGKVDYRRLKGEAGERLASG